MSTSLIGLQLQYEELDIEVTICSVAANLVTSLQFHSNLRYYAEPFLANHGILPFSLILTPIAALLHAMQQMNMESFRNGLIETRNRAVRNSRKLSTGPKWSKMTTKHVF